MERTHIYLEDWQKERIDDKNINKSELLRELLSAYLSHGDVDDAADAVRESRDDRNAALVEDAVETISTIPADERTTSNPAVIKQSGKIERRPEELLDIVEEYEETGEVPER